MIEINSVFLKHKWSLRDWRKSQKSDAMESSNILTWKDLSVSC